MNKIVEAAMRQIAQGKRPDNPARGLLITEAESSFDCGGCVSTNDSVNTSYEVRNATAERVLRDIGGILKSVMPPGYGFTLFIYDYGTDDDPGNMFYMSSSVREDMLKVLKEFIAKQEKQ